MLFRSRFQLLHPFWLLDCLLALKAHKGKKRDLIISVFAQVGRLCAYATANPDATPDEIRQILMQQAVSHS